MLNGSNSRFYPNFYSVWQKSKLSDRISDPVRHYVWQGAGQFRGVCLLNVKQPYSIIRSQFSYLWNGAGSSIRRIFLLSTAAEISNWAGPRKVGCILR